MDQHITVIVKTPEELIFDTTALSLTAINAVGSFDILPYHENFISLITESITIHQQASDKQIPFTTGIVKVYENTVEVFLNAA